MPTTNTTNKTLTPKNKLFIGILLLGLIVNLLVIFDINQFYIRAILAFIFLITIPGLLIMLALKIRNINFWEYLVYTVGLSVSFIMFAGLAVNWILPFLNITDKPLSLWPILICFDTFLLALWLIAHKRNEDTAPILLLPFEEYKIKGKKNLKLIPKFPKLSWLDRIFIIIPMLFPVLSVLGAFILNNNGPNYLTMIMLGSIAVYVFMVVIFRDKLNENVFPWALWMIGLSLLLMFSMRSWYVMGSDIKSEYGTFNLNRYFWDVSSSKLYYNECLSVTILPAILSIFTNLSSHYIFKILFQIIFVFLIPIVYCINKIYPKKIYNFLSCFFFISTPFFYVVMSDHTRQEIAFLFFGLMLLILFSKEINPKIKNLLFVIFGFSMIVSHYTTSYIALALFLFTYIITFFYKRYENRKIKKGKLNSEEKQEVYLTLGVILLLLVFGFLWYSQVTPAANGLIDFTKKSFSNLNQMFMEDLQGEQSSVLDQFNLFYKPTDLNKLLRDYKEELLNNSKRENYSNSYPTFTIHPQIIPPILNPDLINDIYFLGDILDKLLKLIIIIGVFSIILFKKISKEYKNFIFTGFLLLILIMILPLSSIRYDLSRTYQQIAILLAISLLQGYELIFNFLKIPERFNLILIAIMLLLSFLFFSGFIVNIIGGNLPSSNLNNNGEVVWRYYIHTSDLKSLEWYYEKNLSSSSLNLDEYSNKKLFLLNGLNIYSKSLIPETLSKGSVVYAGYTNKIFKAWFNNWKGYVLRYNFPTEFLNNNKNKIYNNGGSEIFK